jgi:hypothetical protein
MKKILLNPLLIIMLFTTIIFSCKKDTKAPSNTCGVASPAQDLPWLKTSISQLLTSNPQMLKYQYVLIADYKGESVFIFGNCDPLAISAFSVFNCSGVKLGEVGDIPPADLKNQKTLWKASDSVCNL